jgi:hypothetical protein
VPWRGTYELTIVYGPEQLARWAGRADLLLIPLALVLWLGWAVSVRRRGSSPQLFGGTRARR